MKKIKKILVLTGGGDCPGLNTVIRALVRSALNTGDWQVLGSKRAFLGILDQPFDIVELTKQTVSGIHVKGGTILETTNKGDPFAYPVKNNQTYTFIDRSDELIANLKKLEIDVVVNIGGDGSQKISQKLFEKGVNIIGVPKTIDNDLSCTDYTFGFQTAVQTATEAVDKLVTTAQSHNRVLITEVMGRDAGWIALHTAIAAGAEIAIIPEIPYNIESIIATLKKRIKAGRGFANIVIAEGAKPIGGAKSSTKSDEVGYQNPLLGGIGSFLMEEIKKHLDLDIRVTVLGHIQRGGIPIAFDRVLATQFGVKAFELIEKQKFGFMVSYQGSNFVDVSIKSAIDTYNLIDKTNYLITSARKIGLCLGD